MQGQGGQGRRCAGLAALAPLIATVPLALGAPAAASRGHFSASSGSAATSSSSLATSSSSLATSSSSLAASSGSSTSSPPPVAGSAVIGLVRQSVDWYRQLQSIEQLPELSDDVVAQDQLQEAALSAVRLAFKFGDAAAPLVAADEQGAAAQSASAALQQASDRMAARVSTLQMQLEAVNAQLAHAAARQAHTLRAQRAEINAALELAREVQGTIGQLVSFQSSSLALEGKSSNSLLGQIQDLKRSVPEASAPATAASAGSTAAGKSGAGKPTAAATPFRPQTAGVFALLGDTFALESAKSQINSGLHSTQALIKQLQALRQPLLTQARALVNTSLADVDVSDEAQLTVARETLRQAADRFNKLSTLLVPLGEQNLVLVNADEALVQWRTALDGRVSSVARYLALRAVVLAASIAVVLVLSEIWRRATFRYLRDPRRRRQFLALRRIAVAIALALVIAFGLVSELGSLATYVGFITAGLAVALQNVILAIVAYFFLIGRYGVNVGDRITLAGVTGRVVEIGLIRIYLMELTGPDLHPAGRIVVLSNAVVFQPQALYKEVPGAAYQWHTIRLTLQATVDVPDARKRLQEAAERVYATYKGSLELRHEAVQRLVEYDTALPGPEVQVGYAENGLRFDVRYPVGREEAATVDLQMLRAMREAIAHAPPLPVVASGEPAIQGEG